MYHIYIVQNANKGNKYLREIIFLWMSTNDQDKRKENTAYIAIYPRMNIIHTYRDEIYTSLMYKMFITFQIKENQLKFHDMTFYPNRKIIFNIFHYIFSLIWTNIYIELIFLNLHP